MDAYSEGYRSVLMKLGLDKFARRAYLTPGKSPLSPEEIEILQHERMAGSFGQGETLRGVHTGTRGVGPEMKAGITERMYPKFVDTTRRLREQGHTWVPGFEQAGGLTREQIAERFRQAAPTSNIRRLAGLESGGPDVTGDIAAKIKRRGASQELAHFRRQGLKFTPQDFKTVAKGIRAGVLHH